MSGIKSCYPLCPLIDQRSFLGVSDDCENGHVVVTLGRNMVIRCKLADQKQVNSWNSKLRLSSPVIFDKNSGQYVGVFNFNTLQMWSEFDVDLNKVKKYKFLKNIHCVLPNNQAQSDEPSSIIVFKDGECIPLTSETLAKRKNIGNTERQSTFPDNYVIEEAHLLHSNKCVVIALVTSIASNNNLLCHFCPLKTEAVFHTATIKLSNKNVTDLANDKHKTVSPNAHLGPVNKNIIQDEIQLTGYTFVKGEPLKLITSWSDGSLYCLEFSPSDYNFENINDIFPGQKIMDITIINTKLKVALLPLDDVGCHIAIYGSDPCEEGALLAIINIKHQVVQCKYDIKLYCTSPRLWSGGSTDLLFIIGQHLAVAHYRLIDQKLAALVGTLVDQVVPMNTIHTDWKKQNEVFKSNSSNKNVNNNSSQAVETYKASNNEKVMTNSTSKKVPDLNELFLNHGYKIEEELIKPIKDSIETLFHEGLSEAGICYKLIPTLLQEDNVKALIWFFNEFNDVPFHQILDVINYCLEYIIRKNISKTNESDDENEEINFEIEASKTFSSDFNESGMNKDLKILLSLVLCTSILPDNKALSVIRSKLPESSTLLLMEYITEFMIEYPGSIRFIEWATLLLDSSYQSFILSKDKNLIKIFKRLNNCVKNQITFLSTWQSLIPLIRMIKSGSESPKRINENKRHNLLYSTDKLNVY